MCVLGRVVRDADKKWLERLNKLSVDQYDNPYRAERLTLDCMLVSTGPGIRVGERGREELASAAEELEADMLRVRGETAEKGEAAERGSRRRAAEERIRYSLLQRSIDDQRISTGGGRPRKSTLGIQPARAGELRRFESTLFRV